MKCKTNAEHTSFVIHGSDVDAESMNFSSVLSKVVLMLPAKLRSEVSYNMVMLGVQKMQVSCTWHHSFLFVKYDFYVFPTLF